MAARKDLGQAEVQKKVEQQEEEGLQGVKVDPTPNAHYTVPGVLAEKPTPETDEKHAADVAAQLKGSN